VSKVQQYDRFAADHKPDPNANALSLRDMLVTSFIPNLSTGTPIKSLSDIIPDRDPDPLPEFGMEGKVEDGRVRNPSQDSYEAAVRGAIDQFEASPYLKSSDGEYDQTLLTAFHPDTTIYSADGKLPPQPTTNDDPNRPKRDAVNAQQHVSQMRGTIIQGMINDLQGLAASGEGNLSAFAGRSVAAQMGLIFKFTGSSDLLRQFLDPDAPNRGSATPGTIQQRSSPNATDVSATTAPVWSFNTPGLWFNNKPPRLRNVLQYAHANTVAIDWLLAWDEGDPSTGRRQDDPEHHLAHYQVRRVSLDGNEPDRDFQVKVPDVLHLEVPDSTDRTKNKLKRCYSRFQFVDHFEGESSQDAAALPEQGKRYVYTITPYDVSLQASTRPISVMARRKPSLAPQVPTDAELWIDYQIPRTGVLDRNDDQPSIRLPDGLTLVWTHPPDPRSGPVVHVGSYQLVFRRDPILPTGFYGLSAEDASAPARGLPSSNAKLQRTDLVREVLASNPGITEWIDPDSGQRRWYYQLSADDLTALLVPTVNNQQWEASSWRVFVQTKSVNGVYSALAPVATKLRFCPQGVRPPVPGDLLRRVEERQVASIEWFSLPFRLDLLPPRDCTGTTGFAMVPMPMLGKTFDNGLGHLEFVRHPQGRRCLHMTWNRGPTLHAPGASRAVNVPPDLIAGYEIYEFDADAHIPTTLNSPGGGLPSFPQWATEARLRKVQEVDLLAPGDVLVTPADTSDFLRWEAWYPSVRRRQQLAEKSVAEAADPTKQATLLPQVSPPWFSWAESLLEWPPIKWDPQDGQGVRRFLEQKPGQDGSTPVWVRSLDNNGRPRSIHPVLAELMERIATTPDDPNPKFRVVRGPLPARMPGSLVGLMSDTGAKADPYGWGLLQLLGLSASFCLRTNSLGDTGDAMTPEELIKNVHDAIQHLNLGGFKRFLHVEYLFQPAKSTRVESDEKFGPSDPPGTSPADLLAIVQLSLRPAAIPWAGYAQATVEQQKSTKPNNPPFTAGKLNITVTGDKNGPTVGLVIQSDTDIERRQLSADNQGGVGKLTTIPFVLPATGKANLYFRIPAPLNIASVAVGIDWTAHTNLIPVDSIPSTTLVPQSADLTTPVSTYFLADVDTVKAASSAVDTTPGGPPEGRTWSLLVAYVGGMNGSSPSAPRNIELPPAVNDPQDQGAELLAWLDRFFLQGGDANKNLNATGDGPWAATAYLRAISPIAVTPDPITGVLDYFHPVEDPYAHAYRYFFRPLGRYDRLWESVAQAPSLVEYSQTLLPVVWGDGSTVPKAKKDHVIIGIDNAGLLHIRVFDRAGNQVTDTDESKFRDNDANGYTIDTIKLQLPGLLSASPPPSIQSRVLEEVNTLVAVPPDVRGRAFEVIGTRLDSLRQIEPPRPGGLDLVLHRTRPISPPTVLHTGRLDALRASTGNGSAQVKSVPPGEYWQVVVAKHPEQTLSEHNQTLTHRLGYRQVSWSLVRKFNPDDVLSQKAILPLLTPRISRPYATPDSTQISVTPHKIFVQLDGPGGIPQQAIDLDPAKDNLNGLAATLQSLELETGKIVATVLTLVPGRFVLKVWSPAGTTLRVQTDAAELNTDILSDANAIRVAKSVRSPALPGPPAQPVPFDASEATQDDNEAIEVELASRLGRFGEGAIALSWKALPYYYEHSLLLIAQSTNTVSEIVAVSQRAFEYVSPVPRAVVDGITNGRIRQRRVQFRLENYWNCLPSKTNGSTDGQEAWPIEDPDRIVLIFAADPGQYPATPTGSDPLAGRVEIDDSDAPLTITWHRYDLSQQEADALDKWRTNATYSNDFRDRIAELLEQLQLRQWRTLSSLPDPAVVYQFVLVKPGGVVQALSEFYYPSDQSVMAKGYTTRNFETKVAGEIWEASQLTTLPEGTDSAHPRDAYLQATLAPQTARFDAWISSRAVTSANAFAIRQSYTATGAHPKPADVPAVLATNLTIELPAAAGGAETLVWRVLSLTQDQSTALQAWETDTTLDQNFRNAVGALRVAVATSLQRAKFVAPDGLTLASFSSTVFSATEVAAISGALLTTPNKPGDAGYQDAVKRFCDRLNTSETITEPVAVGLETLGELSTTVILPTATSRKIVWLGPISADQTNVIQHWIDEVSPFKQTLQALLDRNTNFTIEQSYTAPGAHPRPADIPAELTSSLTIVLTTGTDPEKLVWKGRAITPTQDGKLEAWQNDSTIDQNFRDAVKALRDLLAHPEKQPLSVDVVEPGWQPRPSQADLVAKLGPLADKVQIGIGQVLFRGLMLRDEAEALRARAENNVDRAAVAALYHDALNGGIEGATLQIRAYRGSAKPQIQPMIVSLDS
jgi:hypothetical protein